MIGRPPVTTDPVTTETPPWTVLTSASSGTTQLQPVRTARIVLQVVATAILVVLLVSVLGSFASRKLLNRRPCMTPRTPPTCLPTPSCNQP